MAVPKDPRTLDTAEPFVSLFPIIPDELALLTRSMRDRGFIKDKPILAWRDAFGQKDRVVVVDGHSRRLAALDAGLDEVTVTLRRFDSVDEALAESIEEQATRRNITRSQLVVFVLGALADLDTGERGSGARNDLIGRSARQLGDMLGVSSKTIERARTLLMFGEPELIERVKQGELGLKEAADLARKAGQQDERKPGRGPGGGDDEDEDDETADGPAAGSPAASASAGERLLDALDRPSTDEIGRRLDDALQQLPRGYIDGVLDTFSEMYMMREITVAEWETIQRERGGRA